MKPFHWLLVAFAAALLAVTTYFLLESPEDRKLPAGQPAPEGTSREVRRPTPAPPLFPDSTGGASAAVAGGGTSEEQAARGEEQISAILLDEGISHDMAASRLLALLPALSAEQQEEAAHHISNLSGDEKAAEWARQVVKNTLPPAAAQVLFDDLMNRPHKLLMPALADMADNQEHPRSKDSAEVLEILYGPPEPAGKTWKLWIEERRKAEEAEETQ